MLRLGHGEFLGRGTVVRRTPDLLFYETCHPAHAQLPRHTHENPYFCFVVSGAFTETSHGRARTCEPGTVIFNPAGVEHRDEIGARGSRAFVVQLDPGWSTARCDTTHDPGWVTIGGEMAASLAARLRREAQLWEPTSPLVIEGILMVLAGEALRPGRQREERVPPVWLRRATERLDTSFTAPPSVQELAADAGVHPAYFARCFREFLGCTPGAYARVRRLTWARQQVLGGRLLVEVALAAGFADQAHFTREFKRGFGITPSTYRRSLGT